MQAFADLWCDLKHMNRASLVLAIVLLILLLAFYPAAGNAQATWESWSEKLFAQLEKEFGPTAMKRLRYVHDTARENQNKPVLEKLVVANSALSRLPWISDQQQWSADDYWATPLELIVKVGGDCEDMAIGKYVMLRMMGVPQRNLFLGYAILKTQNEAHMVLVWANDKRTDIRVLDSFVKEVKPAKERKDLQFVYVMDIDNNMALFDDDSGKRGLKAKVNSRKIAKLDALKKQIAETREKYKQYNDGKPLFGN